MILNNYRFRKIKDKAVYFLCLACVIIAVTPLISIIFEVVIRGAPKINFHFLVANNLEGGIGPAIQGTLILIGLTSLIGIPIGILSGVYLAEFGNNKYAAIARTISDILTEIPSIVVGITAFSIIVIGVTGTFSPLAGAVALAFIIIPIIARTTEESLKLVPTSVREAAMALGAHKWTTTIRVVLPTARQGVTTGVLLAVARIAGETAPILLTILGNTYFFQGFNQPMDALPLRIFLNSRQPSTEIQAQAWGAALVLILIVLVLNIIVRVLNKNHFK
ncbi:MAG: phosphate ABC transporter permease PstA [Candidatus Bathyarchaeia archaeon]